MSDTNKSRKFDDVQTKRAKITKSTSSSSRSSSTTSSTKPEKLSAWKRFLNKLKPKSDKEKGEKEAKSKKEKTKKSSPKQASGKKSSEHSAEGQAVLTDAIETWSKQRKLPSCRRHQAVEMLQKQVEQYECEVERRRSRLLEATKSKVFAVTGGIGEKTLRATDDALPYEPKHMNWDQIMEKLQSQPTEEKVSTKEPQQAGETETDRTETSQRTEGTDTSQKTEGTEQDSSKDDKTSTDRDYSTIGSFKEEDVVLPALEHEPGSPEPVEPQITPVTPEMLAENVQTPETTPPEIDRSSRSMSSISSTSSKSSPASVSDETSKETSMQLTDLLVSMIMEANAPRQAEVQQIDLSPTDLAKMSKANADKFEKLTNDNTKQMLFDSQPTEEETDNWKKRKARHQKNFDNKIKFVKEGQDPETIIFCITCKPRHPNYPHAKKR